ncbi:hypothetical protein MY8738_007610 [Beauveria namnaoensis]
MSYNVQLRVFQSDHKTFFYTVEQCVWKYANGGTWVPHNGGQRLTMGGSGTSGILRFLADVGNEIFVIAVGVHNNKPWCDIVANLTQGNTGVAILAEYYNDQDPARVKAREAQRSKWSAKNDKGRTIEASFRSTEGHELNLDITIGST